MTCHKHPKYTAQRKPTARCLLCWLAWLEANPDAVIDAKTLLRILVPLWSRLKVTATTEEAAWRQSYESMYPCG